MHNLHDDILKVLYTNEQITARAKEIAEQLDNDYQDSKPVVLSLLTGSLQFMTLLTSFMKIAHEEDFMKVSSYYGSTASTGNVVIKTNPYHSIEGRDVIIVEDIIDTGLTLSTVCKYLKDMHPKSIEIVTLLDKPYMRKCHDVFPKYSAFENCPNEFVVGFGLDYNELYRQLPYVGVLKPEVYSK